MPGGRGVSFCPSGSTRSSSSCSSSRPVRSEFWFGDFRFFPGPETRDRVLFRGFSFGLVAVSCSGFGCFFPGFFLGRFVFRRCFPLFPFCLLCCLAFLHLLSRARASAGTPAAMAPDPPPVVYWAVPSHPSPAGSRPRYGLVHDGWGVRAPL